MTLWFALAWSAPPADVLEGAWEAWRPQLEAHATYPLTFTESEWQRVSAGKVARRREHLHGADRVVGMIWVDAAPEVTWLSVQDPHGDVVAGMVHEELPGSTFEHRVLYQKVDLPWPLVSRQWVIEVVNNRKLLDATGDALWERTWTLSDRRGAAAEDPKAVWLPVNDGGWAFLKVGGGTLLIYHVRSVVGGNVPDELATRWSFGTLTGMLEGIAGRVPWVQSHYVGAHPPIRRPGGQTLPPFSP